jgi:hypothetical protein
MAEPLNLTVTTEATPFTIRADSVAAFVLTGGNSDTVSLSLSPTLTGNVDLRGPQGETPKGLQGYCSGRPLVNEVVIATTAPYAFDIDVSASRAEALVAATATTIFTIEKEGVVIGTITFGAGETLGVFNITDTEVSLNDMIVIIAPSSEDVTLANITFLLAS